MNLARAMAVRRPDLLDGDEYPTEAALEMIRKWDIIRDGVDGLLQVLEGIWWASDWGFHLSGKRVRKLALHTGGWSGNEDVIGALRENLLFWAIYWDRSDRGGHFYFTIRPMKKSKKEKEDISSSMTNSEGRGE